MTRITTVLCAVAIAVWASCAAAAPGDPKVVDGITVYLGVVPTELIRGYSAGHEETTMHGGVPSGSGFHHVVVFFVDTRPHHSENMQVRATVRPLGLAPEVKVLQPMRVGSTDTYGNYFSMPGGNPFGIAVELRRPGERNWHRVDFEYRHPR